MYKLKKWGQPLNKQGNPLKDKYVPSQVHFTSVCLPTPIEMTVLTWWHNPEELDLANFISSASCAPGSQPQQKKVQWKCCIKPLIRVEHIRIILRAESVSCYAAACVVLLAREFSLLIDAHVSARRRLPYGRWYLMRCVDGTYGNARGVCATHP